MFEGLEVHEQIGRGASGSVFRATTSSGETVAVKQMHSEIATDPGASYQFVREWQVVAQVSHPNVVAMRDLKVAPDELAIVMDYVPGGTLAKAMRDPSFEPREILRICSDIARGLAAIHDANIVHRDLKPANILVEGQGSGLTPKIADFGLSRMLGDSVTRLTNSGAGTPMYISPEAAQGDRTIGKPADVYSFGATLFHWLTRRPPFEGSLPLSLIRAHAEDPPPGLGGVPVELADLMSRMLAKDPEQRPRADAVADQLDKIAALLTPGHQPHAIDPVSAEEIPSETVLRPKGSQEPSKLPSVQPTGFETTVPGRASINSFTTRRRRSLAVGAFALVAVALSAGAFLLSRGGNETSDPNGQLALAFEPEFYEDGLIVVRNWQVDSTTEVLQGSVSLINSSSSPLVDIDYYEVVVDQPELTLEDYSFDPSPDEILEGEKAVRFGMDQLAPEETRNISYEIVGAGPLTSKADLEELAQAMLSARADFLDNGESSDRVKLSDVRLESLRLAPERLALRVGDPAAQLTLTGTLSDGSSAPSDVLELAVWTVADTGVAKTSESGAVSPISEGTSTAKVQIGGLSATAAIEVTGSDVALSDVAAPSSSSSSAETLVDDDESDGNESDDNESDDEETSTTSDSGDSGTATTEVLEPSSTATPTTARQSTTATTARPTTARPTTAAPTTQRPDPTTAPPAAGSCSISARKVTFQGEPLALAEVTRSGGLSGTVLFDVWIDGDTTRGDWQPGEGDRFPFGTDWLNGRTLDFVAFEAKVGNVNCGQARVTDVTSRTSSLGCSISARKVVFEGENVVLAEVTRSGGLSGTVLFDVWIDGDTTRGDWQSGEGDRFPFGTDWLNGRTLDFVAFEAKIGNVNCGQARVTNVTSRTS